MLERTTWIATAIALCITSAAATEVHQGEPAGEARGQVVTAEYSPTVDVTQTISAPDRAELDFSAPVIKVTVTPPVRPPSASTAQGKASEGARVYRFNVPLAGHQRAIDRCDGFVWEDFEPFGHVVSAHNYCGGAVILRLHIGDTVYLTGHGKGTYRVASIKVVPKGSRSSVLEGKLWMQTCFFDRPSLRLVQLVKLD
jgi:hypothetical protein